MQSQQRWQNTIVVLTLGASLIFMGAGCASNMRPAAKVTKPQPIATSTTSTSTTLTPQLTEKQAELRLAMRRLWEDHITWTRLYIISAAENIKDKDLTAERLLKNQQDIGNAIKPYYGAAAGNQLTALLKEHIAGAVLIIDAAKAGESNNVQKAINDWRQNGQDIATFLHDLNTQYWPTADLEHMMQKHLDTTINEATNRLGKKYADDIRDYDIVKDHIYLLADSLSDGIIKQFPEKF